MKAEVMLVKLEKRARLEIIEAEERERQRDHERQLELATALHREPEGKALDVYSLLSRDDVFKKDVLKEALLKRYLLTEQGFRKKFRYSNPEKEETFGQFILR
ncbi:hypothetical protein CHS0354_014812 [Potamilus streckersoni]|uniref:Uncharacterized protein n=1 Tax=Potamilus streckersoni TaxID=2493646 RepID=A0AAE0RVM6_9BIVA|nr:hypothetical protein CHS0354_014812 [Potamilus streckersoni]